MSASEMNAKITKCACPYCDTAIEEARWPYCGGCGEELAFCPSCGKETSRKLDACKHCGAKIR